MRGCDVFGENRIKHFMGHVHCNRVEVGNGYMVGGFGMEDFFSPAPSPDAVLDQDVNVNVTEKSKSTPDELRPGFETAWPRPTHGELEHGIIGTTEVDSNTHEPSATEKGCENIGIPILDTTDERFRVYFFMVQDAHDDKTKGNYDVLMKCMEQNNFAYT